MAAAVKTALVCGISGQDGSYLANSLLHRDYDVWGTSRDAQATSLDKLEALGIRDLVHMVSVSLTDFSSILEVLDKVRPDEIYNFSGQSSVSLSFEQPRETLESIITGTSNLLEAIRFTGIKTRFYNAASSECFGDTDIPADECTPFRPRSPYAVAKAAAFNLVANYREAYSLYACSGILFNHESPLRPERFVTQKIVSAVRRIAAGNEEKLSLGNISVQRDWGWAPEYIEAMHLMLSQDVPDDYVIATGETNSLEAFIDAAFSSLNLDWHEYVTSDAKLLRPTDLKAGRANPAKAYEKLGWRAQYKMHDVVRMMLEKKSF